MRLLLVLILFLICCSCPKHPANSIPLIVILDQDFTPEQQERMQVAIHEWKYVLNYQFGKTIYVHKITSKAKEAQKPQTLIAYAFANEIGGNQIYMVDDRKIWLGNENYRDWEPDDYRKILLHEMGHTLGLPHSDNLMAPGYTGANFDCVDDKTIVAFARTNKLNAVNLRPDPYCK